MRLQELTDQGYKLQAWTVSTIRSERRIVLKLKRNKKLYVAHSPFVDTMVSNVEFTEPVGVK